MKGLNKRGKNNNNEKERGGKFIFSISNNAGVRTIRNGVILWRF